MNFFLHSAPSWPWVTSPLWNNFQKTFILTFEANSGIVPPKWTFFRVLAHCLLLWWVSQFFKLRYKDSSYISCTYPTPPAKHVISCLIWKSEKRARGRNSLQSPIFWHPHWINFLVTFSRKNQAYIYIHFKYLYIRRFGMKYSYHWEGGNLFFKKILWNHLLWWNEEGDFISSY